MTTRELPLAGRTAVVTGGGRGIGRGYALRLAALGADVAIVDRDVRSYREYEGEAAVMTADSTMAEVEETGRRSLGYDADVSDREALAAAVDEIVATWGRLDIAVCNAGGGGNSRTGTGAATAGLEPFTTAFDSNVLGTVNLCQLVAPAMQAQGYGRIVTIASQAGRRASRDGSYAHYGTAKAAVVMYTRYLAQELGPFGITVNCLAPGYIETGRLATMYDQLGRDEVLQLIALRRIGTVEDCARVLEFLVTGLGDYVTGALIPVDGGSVP